MNLVDDIALAITFLKKSSIPHGDSHELNTLKDWLLARNIYSMSDLEKQFEYCLYVQERDLIKNKL